MMKAVSNVNNAIGRTLHIPTGLGAFYISAPLCIAICITWIVLLLLPWGWQSNDDIFYTFQTSLYSFDTVRNPEVMKEHQRHKITKLTQLFDTLNEREPIWLSVAKWAFCRNNISAEWCDFIHRLQIASTMVIWLSILGVCCLFMGVMTGFYFHFIKPRQDMQKWATAYLITAPVAFNIGLAQYWYMTRDFSLLFGEPDSALGFAFYIGCAISSLSSIACWIMISFAFRSSYDEDKSSSEELDADSEGGYGSVFHSFQQRLSGAAAGEAAMIEGILKVGAMAQGAPPISASRAQYADSGSDVDSY